MQKEAFDLLKKYENELNLNEEVRDFDKELETSFELTANK